MTPDIRPLSVAPISMATLEGIDANPDWATILDQLSPPHTPRTSLAPCPAARDARPAPARSTVHDGVPLPPRSHGKALCEARRVDEGAGRQHTGSQTRPVQLSVHSLRLLQRPTDNASVGPSEAAWLVLRTGTGSTNVFEIEADIKVGSRSRRETGVTGELEGAGGVCEECGAVGVCLGFGDGEFGTEDLTPPTRGRGFPGDRAGNWLDPPASSIATLGSTSWACSPRSQPPCQAFTKCRQLEKAGAVAPLQPETTAFALFLQYSTSELTKNYISLVPQRRASGEIQLLRPSPSIGGVVRVPGRQTAIATIRRAAGEESSIH
ncbi:hypothetical protein DFH06DRAFT_1321829 [Mycena polygramma]|nr:hypothetical protein DFH06DRAFT_1321829 [Mycena polygramma]